MSGPYDATQHHFYLRVLAHAYSRKMQGDVVWKRRLLAMMYGCSHRPAVLAQVAPRPKPEPPRSKYGNPFIPF